MAAPHGVPVVVAGCGAMTALGLSAPASAAAVRAGLSAAQAHAFCVDQAGAPMVVAAAPYLDPALPVPARLALLAIGAAVEALGGVGPQLGAPLPVLLGVPPRRPGRPDTLDSLVRHLGPQLQARTGARCGPVRLIETGHAAGTSALAEAWAMVRSGACPFVLAGGVDSYLEPQTLEWLEACDQLHAAGAHNNPYGFVPGEAAGFVLLADAGRVPAGAAPVLALAAAASQQEAHCIKTDTVCTGQALTQLFEQLAAAAPHGRVDQLLADLNGEPYRADEYGFAAIRAGLLADASAVHTPADCWGDVGAASGPLFLVLADAAVRRGYAAGPAFAAFTGSESGQRCGFVALSTRT